MKRYCLTLDLKNDEQLIKDYIAHHEQVWPEIIESIQVSGIEHMSIYHVHTRLFMIIDAADTFSFESKSKMDASNPKVQEWETLMDRYQQRLPFAKADQKWVLMDQIFNLKK